VKADAVQRCGRQQSWMRYGDVYRTPPGSETRACIHGGNPGLDPGYRVRIGRTERTRKGHLAVLADHSTDGQGLYWLVGGEPRPKGPTVGKEKPGITFFWRERWKALRGHKPYQRNFRELRRAAKLCAKRGVACLVSNPEKKVRTEEPYEGNLHVRDCGGSGWVTAASTRNLTGISLALHSGR